VGRGADGEGYDKDIMALESFCKIVDVGVVDFGDGNRVGKRRLADGTGEGGDGVVAKGEKFGEDVVAYVSCCLSSLSDVCVREMCRECERLTPTMATFLI